jgi:hypothetical protein
LKVIPAVLAPVSIYPFTVISVALVAVGTMKPGSGVAEVAVINTRGTVRKGGLKEIITLGTREEPVPDRK